MDDYKVRPGLSKHKSVRKLILSYPQLIIYAVLAANQRGISVAAKAVPDRIPNALRKNKNRPKSSFDLHARQPPCRIICMKTFCFSMVAFLPQSMSPLFADILQFKLRYLHLSLFSRGPSTFGDAANASRYAAGYIMVTSSCRVDFMQNEHH